MRRRVAFPVLGAAVATDRLSMQLHRFNTLIAAFAHSGRRCVPLAVRPRILAARRCDIARADRAAGRQVHAFAPRGMQRRFPPIQRLASPTASNELGALCGGLGGETKK